MSLNLEPGTVIAVGVLLPSIATVAVGLRFYTRRLKRVPLKEDDWTVLASLVLVWGLGITNIVGAVLGALGAHSPPAPPNAPHHNTITRGPKDEIAERIVLGYSIVEKLAFGLIKISVLLAYRRIFRGKTFNILSLGMIAVCALLAIGFLITSSLQCHVRNWGLQYLSWSHRHHCVQAEISWTAFAITDVVTDIVILIFPIPQVWKLQMSFSKKVSVSLVFLLGALSTAIGITRMAVIIYFTYGESGQYRDLLGMISTALIWSVVEASVAVFASSIPAIRPLIAKAPSSDAEYKSFGTSRSNNKSNASPSPLRPRVIHDFDDIDDRQHVSLVPK